LVPLLFAFPKGDKKTTFFIPFGEGKKKRELPLVKRRETKTKGILLPSSQSNTVIVHCEETNRFSRP
jgi:hypothetical protein